MHFMGYVRNDGKAGTRNLVAVLPLVFCANHVARRIADAVQGAVAFPHPVGCGYPGPDQELTAHIIKRIALHPNFGAVLFVGLGCERVRLEDMPLAVIEKLKPWHSLSIQEVGDSCKAIAQGVLLTQTLVRDLSKRQRQKCPLAALTLGLKCGGTDAFSGLAANPALGIASDLLLERGGTSLLTEITELCGTENIMARRAATPETGRRIMDCVASNERWLQHLTSCLRRGKPASVGSVMLVSPGNAEGGVSNVVEKALGGLKKAGSAVFQGLLDYGAPPQGHGLYLMDGPGHDGEAVTGQVASGANLIAFTTGRGTPAGFPGVPVVKITGNPELFQSMIANLDFDAGRMFRQGRTLKRLGRELFAYFVRVASGELTKAEVLGHEELFCISRYVSAHASYEGDCENQGS